MPMPRMADAARVASAVATNPMWVFSFPHQLALPEREMAGRWWQGPDSESDCCCSMDAFELEVSGAVTGREAIDGLA